MFDYTDVVSDKLEYADKQSSIPSHGLLNGFNGVFNISDVDLIPETLVEYLAELFPARNKRQASITLADINSALNEVWDGPGSVKKVVALTWEMKTERHRKDEEDDK